MSKASPTIEDVQVDLEFALKTCNAQFSAITKWAEEYKDGQ